jgi:hypothetical protein
MTNHAHTLITLIDHIKGQTFDAVLVEDNGSDISAMDDAAAVAAWLLDRYGRNCRMFLRDTAGSYFELTHDGRYFRDCAGVPESVVTGCGLHT